MYNIQEERYKTSHSVRFLELRTFERPSTSSDTFFWQSLVLGKELPELAEV
jgi:hypothetical protein